MVCLWDMIEKVLQEMFCFVRKSLKLEGIVVFRDAVGLETLRWGRQKGLYLEDGKKEVLGDTPSFSLPFLPPDS